MSKPGYQRETLTDEAEIVPKAEDEVDLSVVDRFTHVRKSVGRQSVWSE